MYFCFLKSGNMNKVFLRKKISNRIQSGHNWVFDNEIGDIIRSTNDEEEDEVSVYSHTGSFVGKGWIYPKAKIAIRMLSRNPQQPIHKEWIKEKITSAIDRRNNQLKDIPIKRLFYGESDGISGLIIDQWNDYICVQCNTQALDKRFYQIQEILLEVGYTAEQIIQDNSNKLRGFEDLPIESNVTFPAFKYQEGASVFTIESNLSLSIDRRLIRKYLAQNSSGKTVWDLFCGNGNLGKTCLFHQAKSLVFIDNEQIYSYLKDLEPFKNHQFIQENVFDFLKKKTDQSPEIIILDTPVLGGKDLKLNAYKELGLNALKHLKQEGILVWGTSSSKIKRTDKLVIIKEWIQDLKVNLLIENEFQADTDFPIHPLYEHSEYLHFFCIRLVNWYE